MSVNSFFTQRKGFISGNSVKLIRGGKEYFTLLCSMIDNAGTSFHLQTYIFDEDDTGTMVADALMRAAQRKVAVYLMADGYASQHLSNDFIEKLQSNGVQFRYFEPIFRSKRFYFGRRLHHKVAVADGKCALVAGINISNRYNDMPGKPAWLDFGIYVEGPIASSLEQLCEKTWNGYLQQRSFTTTPKPYPTDGTYQTETHHNIWVRMRRNDWVRRKNQISRSYLEMFRSAQKDITILGSYFLPGRNIRKALANAAARGVNIRVIVAGPSDVMMAKHAERYMYNWLLKNGIRIFEYQENILHGKIAVCDDAWVTIGSYNVNNISAFASIELNLDVYDQAFAQHVRHVLENIMQRQCIPITWENFMAHSSVWTRFLRWFSYTVFRIVFFLFTFYFKQSDLR